MRLDDCTASRIRARAATLNWLTRGTGATGAEATLVRRNYDWPLLVWSCVLFDLAADPMCEALATRSVIVRHVSRRTIWL
jgi:hypothetical protein